MLDFAEGMVESKNIPEAISLETRPQRLIL
jgi:hypothetical protein